VMAVGSAVMGVQFTVSAQAAGAASNRRIKLRYLISLVFMVFLLD